MTLHIRLKQNPVASFDILTLGLSLATFLLPVPQESAFAYIYECGNNTIWGSMLRHAANNALIYVFVFPTDIQPVATVLYLVVGFVLTIAILLWAYRGRYAHMRPQVIEQPSANSASFRK